MYCHRQKILCLNKALMQKYRHALLRRLWNVFKLLEGEGRLWGSSCTQLSNCVKA